MCLIRLMEERVCVCVDAHQMEEQNFNFDVVVFNHERILFIFLWKVVI